MLVWNQIAGKYSKDHEYPNDDSQGVVVDVPVGLAQATNHKRKLADLGEVDGRQTAQAGTATQHEHEEVDANPSEKEHENRDAYGCGDRDESRHWNLHT